MNAMIILLFLLGLFVIGLGVLVYFEFLKRDSRKTRVIFIYKDNSSKLKKVKRISDVITFENKTYHYDKKYVIRRGNKDYIYFKINNPFPLDFDVTKKLTFTAKNFNTFLEENVFSKLLGGANADFKTLKIMQIIVIIGIVAIIMYFALGGEKVINIASPENKAFIQEAVRSALK